MTVTQVTTALQAKGYTCTDTRHVPATWLTSCSLTDDQHGTSVVSLAGSDSASVSLVSAGTITRPGGGPPTSAQASQLFTAVVGAVAQGSDASRVNSWIQPNLDAGGHTTVGVLRLDLERPGGSYLLVISAA